MTELKISTADLSGTTVSEVMKEIENNADMLDTARAISERKNVAIGDMVEAIASHIVYEDEDYICE